MRGLKERLARLGERQSRLRPSPRAIWRGLLVVGVVLIPTLLAAPVVIAWNPGIPVAEPLGSALVIALLLGLLRAIEERWAEQAPWPTTLAVTLLAYLGCALVVCQWHYTEAIGLGQVAAWQAALDGIRELDDKHWAAFYVFAQPLGAAVLFRRGMGTESLVWGNVTLIAFSYILALIVIGLVERWLWRLPLRQAGLLPEEPES